MEDQHVYHHLGDDGPKVAVKLGKTPTGYNWEVAVSGCPTVNQALELLAEAAQKMQTTYSKTD